MLWLSSQALGVFVSVYVSVTCKVSHVRGHDIITCRNRPTQPIATTRPFLYFRKIRINRGEVPNAAQHYHVMVLLSDFIIVVPLQTNNANRVKYFGLQKYYYKIVISLGQTNTSKWNPTFGGSPVTSKNLFTPKTIIVSCSILQLTLVNFSAV